MSKAIPGKEVVLIPVFVVQHLLSFWRRVLGVSAPAWHSAQVVAPGFRLGWVTAAPAVIQKLVFQLHGISLGACSFTQARGRPVLRFRFTIFIQALCAERVFQRMGLQRNLLLPLSVFNCFCL